uniref:Uncharacterized protein n=1 Tax=Octopus bimaculoides TaxID=37653 RepID=A0A0L8FLT6_OCTBM
MHRWLLWFVLCPLLFGLLIFEIRENLQIQREIPNFGSICQIDLVWVIGISVASLDNVLLEQKSEVLCDSVAGPYILKSEKKYFGKFRLADLNVKYIF